MGTSDATAATDGEQPAVLTVRSSRLRREFGIHLICGGAPALGSVVVDRDARLISFQLAVAEELLRHRMGPSHPTGLSGDQLAELRLRWHEPQGRRWPTADRWLPPG